MPFPASRRRIVLESPNGARIVLDADEAKIQMFGINGDLLAELDAAQEFFGDSLFVQKIYDSAGGLRSQWSGLQLFIDGNDGTVEIKAGSSGVDNSMPQITMKPTGAAEYGGMLGKGEASNGAALYISSPSFGAHTRARFFMFAQNDTDPPHIDFLDLGFVFVDCDLQVTGNAAITGDLTVDDVTGDVVTVNSLTAPTVTVATALVADGVDVLGAWQTYTVAWTASVGVPAVGNGTLTGRYMEVGRTFTVSITLTAGGTTTFGTAGAFWSFSMPTAFGTATKGFTGTWRSTDAGFQEYSGVCAVDPGGDLIQLFKEVGRHANNSPFAFGSADSMVIDLTAESNS